MTGRKGSSKRKDGAASPLADAGEWNKSKCSESVLLNLAKDDLLQEKDIISWRAPESDVRPSERTGETLLFQHFAERDLALPASDFF